MSSGCNLHLQKFMRCKGGCRNNLSKQCLFILPSMLFFLNRLQNDSQYCSLISILKLSRLQILITKGNYTNVLLFSRGLPMQYFRSYISKTKLLYMMCNTTIHYSIFKPHACKQYTWILLCRKEKKVILNLTKVMTVAYNP